MRFSPVCLVALCIALCIWSGGRAETSTKPNIIFILADDLGLDGVSCYGSDTRKTPNIDLLAASGMRFETCYSAPLCGPSRCALLTGRYAFRAGGITNQSWRADGPGAKSQDEHPFPKRMKQGGYTTGMAGKLGIRAARSQLVRSRGKLENESSGRVVRYERRAF